MHDMIHKHMASLTAACMGTLALLAGCGGGGGDDAAGGSSGGSSGELALAPSPSSGGNNTGGTGSAGGSGTDGSGSGGGTPGALVTEGAASGGSGNAINAAAAWHLLLTVNGQNVPPYTPLLQSYTSDTTTVEVRLQGQATGATFPPDGRPWPMLEVKVSTLSAGDTQAQPLGAARYYYDAASDGVQGVQNLLTGECSTATPGPALPTTAMSGDSGTLYMATDRADCSAGAAQVGTTLATWSVQSPDSQHHYFCVQSQSLDLNGQQRARSRLCVQVVAG
jgi:hypothetical protein